MRRYLWVLALAFLAAGQGVARAEDVPFETIDEGEVSRIGYEDVTFQGAEFLIRDRFTWERFWRMHTGGLFPLPPLPEVRFPQENVVAVLLGYQSSGGGPFIRIVGIEQLDREVRIHVEENRRPGPLPVITNPYHIVKTPRLRGSVSLVHHGPGLEPEKCRGLGDCPQGFVCDIHDWTCQDPDRIGLCVLRPGACLDTWAPVCGCDGVTYPNDCYRLMAGATLKHPGPCM